MVYDILKILLLIFIPTFYRRLKYKNLHKLPTDKPVFLTMNHPNAFLDALMPSIVTKQRLNYLARGDAFSGGFMNWLLNSVNIIPIYRKEEGAENLHKNEESFEECYARLAENKTIVMFPEGICVQEKRIRKLKKGMARIAFGAIEENNYDLDLKIVPMLSNYSRASKFRSRAFCNFGDPIEYADLIPVYKENPVKGINELTRRIQKEMVKYTIVINNKQNDDFVDQFQEIHARDLLEREKLNYKDPEDLHKLENAVVHTINHHDAENEEKITSLRDKTKAYINKVRKMGMRDHIVKKKQEGKINLFIILWDLILLAIGLPFHLFGVLNYYIPYAITFTMAPKLAKKREFYGSIWIAFAIILFPLFYAINILVAWLIFGFTWKMGIYVFLSPLCGRFAISFWPFMRKLGGKLKMFFSSKKKTQELTQTRSELTTSFDDLIESYSGYKEALEPVID